MIKNITKLFKHSLTYGLGNVASKALAFLLIPLYTAYLNPEDYGILQICRIITALLTVFLMMGMSSSMFRVYYNVKDHKDKSLIVNTTLNTFFIASILILTPLIIFSSKLSGVFLGVEQSQYVFIILLATIFCESFFTLQLAVLRAEERSRLYSIITIIRVVLYAAFSLIFIAFLKQNYIGALKAGLYTLILIVIGTSRFTIKGYKLELSYNYIKEILHIGIPLAIGGLGIWVLNLSDRYMLKLLLPPDVSLFHIGLYSLGDRIASITKFLVVMPFMLAWGALMFSYEKEENAKEIYKTVMNYFCFVTGLLALFVNVFSKEIIQVMSQNVSYYDAFKIVPILSFSKIMSGLIIVISVGVIITKKSKYVAISNFIAAICNIIFNFILIPRYFMFGAAIGSLLAFIINFLILFYFAQRSYYISYEMKKISIFFFTLLLISIASIFIGFYIKLFVFFIVVALIPTFKLITYSQIKSFCFTAIRKIKK
jgi:O-antigen/teichoic acid export membrane protein